DQAVALLEAADGDAGPQAARTAALASALLYTGARVSELLGADIEDLGTDRGHRVLRVRRKGGKIQALALPAPAASRIDAYLAGRDDVTALPAVPGGTAAAARRRVLFATGTGARMYRAEVRTLLRRLGRAAGLPEVLVASLSPHSMRHACATCRTPWGMPPRAPPDATTAAAATWTAHPATCSPGTSTAPAERRARAGADAGPTPSSRITSLSGPRTRPSPAVPFWRIPVAPHMDVYVHARPVARSEARFLPPQEPGTGARPCPRGPGFLMTRPPVS